MAKTATTKRTKPIPVGKGKLGYTTSNVFRAPLKRVWEAATQSKHLRKYFIDGSEGEFGASASPLPGYGKNTVVSHLPRPGMSARKKSSFAVPDPTTSTWSRSALNSCAKTERLFFVSTNQAMPRNI